MGKTLKIQNGCGKKRSSDVAKEAWTAEEVNGLNEPTRKRAKKDGKRKEEHMTGSGIKGDGTSIFASYVSPFIQNIGKLWNSIGGSTDGSSRKAKTDRDIDNEPLVLGLTDKLSESAEEISLRTNKTHIVGFQPERLSH